MFEGSRVPDGWRQKVKEVDLVWVPSSFSKESFVQSGLEEHKVQVIPEPVDTDFFTPRTVQSTENKDKFRFLSVFKWEKRKGWDVLLDAYTREFSKNDRVELLIKTSGFHLSSQAIEEQVGAFFQRTGRSRQDGAQITILTHHMSSEELRELYRSASSFVFPSRGEGWGRHLVEAMSMGLPVVASRWSGPKDFLSDLNSLPLLFREVPAEGGEFQGAYWAEPDAGDLGVKMRTLFQDGDLRQRIGRQAREDMLQRYSKEKVGLLVRRALKEASRDRKVKREEL